MRVEYEDEDLARLFTDPEYRQPRYGSDLTKQFRKKVGFLYAATPRDLYSYRALRFEKLKGDRDGQHSIRLNDQWRLIVRLVSDDPGPIVVVTEIVDYH